MQTSKPAITIQGDEFCDRGKMAHKKRDPIHPSRTVKAF